jgi:hypothetical protein
VQLQLSFKGDSWVVFDGSAAVLYDLGKAARNAPDRGGSITSRSAKPQR